MTISSSTARIEYVASGLTSFSYTWRILDQDDLLVILRDTAGTETTQTIGTDYTVTGVGTDAGGTIVFTAAPTSTDVVVIILDPDRVQDLDLTSGSLPASSVETALDKIVNMVKRVYDIVSRSLTLTDGATDGSGSYDANNNTISNLANPSADQDAATKAYTDAAIASATGGSNTTISAFGATLIDDANASVARTTLGAGATGSNLFTAGAAATALGYLGMSSFTQAILLNANSSSDWRSLLFVPDLIAQSNRVINGDFKIWQLGTSITNSTTFVNNDGNYFADQWYFLTSVNGSVNLSSNATTFGYPTGCFGIAELAAVTTDKFAVVHPIEAATTVPLRSKTVGVSFFSNSNSNLRSMRCHLVSWSTAFTPDVITRDVVSTWNGATTKPTAISNVTLVDAASTSLFTCGASAWSQHFFSFTVPADAINIGIFIGSDDGSYAGGDKIAISGVQLSTAALATPFQSRPFGDELRLCERFYQKTFPYSTAPATNLGVLNGTLQVLLDAQGTGNPRAQVYWPFRNRMVKIPVVVPYSPTAASTDWDVVGNATTATTTVTGESENGVLIYSSTLTGTGVLSIHATADARL